MMITLLLSSLLVGFSVMVMSDSQLSIGDLRRTEAFYAAQAGLEQLTADLGTLFVSTPTPTAAQVNALVANPPLLPNTEFVKPDGSSGYEITFPSTGGTPTTTEINVASGPFAGLVGHVTPYTLTATVLKGEGAEASLERLIQTVSMPIFEFGVFATQDISFFPDQAFSVAGRVHTNFNLFAATNGGPLQFTNRLSAVGDVVRTDLPNGYPVDTWGGDVDVTTAPGVYRTLAANEGSLVGALGSALNEPTWFNLSTGTYNSRIISGRTGARRLRLPVSLLPNGQPIDIIRRPIPGETTAAALFPERHFSKASLRILLSDDIADITSLPSVTGSAPINLATAAWPFALSKEGTDPTGFPAEYAEGYRFPANTSLLGGFLKIDVQTTPGTWLDVTTEILNLGFIGQAVRGDGLCTGQVPHPDAVIRLQHVREGGVSQNPDCGVPYPAAPNATDYWPNVLFDAREGLEREDADPLLDRDPHLGGLMHYVELDIGNLARWLAGVIGTSGASALNDNGYTVYVSDRRTNNDPLQAETGEYGYEDFVNTGVSGTPNGINESGEDVNGNGTLDTYGMMAKVGGAAPLDSTATPVGTVPTPVGAAIPNAVARANPAIFFRRALKLVNGGLGNLPVDGLTVTSENPVYVQGHYNANDGGFGNPHTQAAVIADAVTLLSTAWNDWFSLSSPHFPQAAAPTYYRFAVAAGTSLSYDRPGGTPTDFGTDGGVQNLMRLLEDWTGDTLYYRGSLAPLWISRQARGSFKCCSNVFTPPTTLVFEHDTDFLDMTKQPPATPHITDVNITGFRQIFSTQ